MVIRIKKSLLNRFTPESLMDWGEVRKSKSRCENKCGRFNTNMGGCSLGLLPDPHCEKFREVIRISRKRGSSSAEERLYANEEVTGSSPVSRSPKY